jgi:hypothetical protein
MNQVYVLTFLLYKKNREKTENEDEKYHFACIRRTSMGRETILKFCSFSQNLCNKDVRIAKKASRKC